MGILEIHFHDSDFSWTVNPRESDGRSLSLGSGESSGESGGRATERGSPLRKVRMVAMLGVLVGLGVAVTRLRNRRMRASAESEQKSSGRRLSLSRLK